MFFRLPAESAVFFPGIASRMEYAVGMYKVHQYPLIFLIIRALRGMCMLQKKFFCN